MKKSPDPIDVLVGARLRERRIALSISQERLGAKLGLTFQQIQKYEKGANRIGASRLFQIAQILKAPVEYFFEGAVAETAGSCIHRSEEAALMADADVHQLSVAFHRIRDDKTRKRLLELVKSLSELETGELSA